MTIIHDPRCAAYEVPDHPERPARVTTTADLLRRSHPDWTWVEPGPVTEEELHRAHARAHLNRLEQGPDFDADTAFLPGIKEHARRSAGAALTGMRLALHAGEKSFSLMRPPGHHATRSRAMGFCYLNQVAIAALAAQADGVERVAVWDFDAHHGNGTEEILGGQPGIIYASVHEASGYPHTGLNSTPQIRNWALGSPPSRDEHLSALAASWAAILAFQPGLVLVSAGFDAFRGDPLTDMALESSDFGDFGAWIRKSGLPAAAILEGGYSAHLPELIDRFLCGWNGPNDKT